MTDIVTRLRDAAFEFGPTNDELGHLLEEAATVILALRGHARSLSDPDNPNAWVDA